MSSTTSAAPSSSSTGTAGGSGSFLRAGGSTLILAFLAIGLFAGGLLVMFSMRRYVVRNSRRMQARNSTSGPLWPWDDTQLGPPPTLLMSIGVRMRRLDDFGKKPELWDISTARSMSKEGDWGKIMPIAARPVYDDRFLSSPYTLGQHTAASGQHPSASTSTSLASPPGYLFPFRIGLRDTRAQIASLRPFRPRHRPGDDAPPSGEADGMPSRVAERVPACVEVALAIALPAQAPCQEGRVPLYALGVTNARWSGESLDLVEDTSDSPSGSARTDSDDTARVS
ncbi:hypothetical protein DICSQDRAFT_181978 [Dichomitus squalens LYAD-421 SS1]|uniref:Uncharacterized protein n=1 Tax=Dichomitus squalens (strain LYAD-421) TaxID=732165 RepID=R7SSW8_DICSQ|nr:uncharacterized protein DICSQDRAFT_181978 [Dichomitus squalens LYAD-421 SS1]EJF59289.1 hypothetical protein DICSQDRAFT_181978 [Dichomitus squalens LYAD-421 SS1]